MSTPAQHSRPLRHGAVAAVVGGAAMLLLGAPWVWLLRKRGLASGIAFCLASGVRPWRLRY